MSKVSLERFVRMGGPLKSRRFAKLMISGRRLVTSPRDTSSTLSSDSTILGPCRRKEPDGPLSGTISPIVLDTTMQGVCSDDEGDDGGLE